MGGNSIFAVTLWIVSRLAQAEARGQIFLIFGGILGIFQSPWATRYTRWSHECTRNDGNANGSMAFFGSYAIIALLILIIHRSRKKIETIAPQWFLLASLLWFPLLFLVAWHGLEIDPARGTVQSILSMWFGQSLIWLWLTPVALGCAYYIIPSIIGKPIDKYYFSYFRVLVHCLACSLVCCSPLRRWTSPYVGSCHWHSYEHCNDLSYRRSFN